MSLIPKVFDVEYFFDEIEATKIREYGESELKRSQTSASNGTRQYSKSRTSSTTFIKDSKLTRDFQHRAI